MNKQIIRALLLALPLFSVQQLSAQNNQDRYAVKYKNTFLVGMNFAINGSGDQLSYFYRNEYIRRLNHYFEAGIGLGFFNYQHHPNESFNNLFTPGTHYEELSQTSIVSLDPIGYLNVIDGRRSFLKFGLGYSIRFVEAISPQETYYYVTLAGKKLFTTDYYTEKGIDGGIIVHLEYGRRITPHFAISTSIRFYAEGKYVSLSTIGVNLSYSF